MLSHFTYCFGRVLLQLHNAVEDLGLSFGVGVSVRFEQSQRLAKVNLHSEHLVRGQTEPRLVEQLLKLGLHQFEGALLTEK